MKRTALMLAIAVTAFAGCDKDDDEVDMRDTGFMMKAAVNNMAEIDAGQLASTKATNASVQQFGQLMVMEHTVALSELDSIADKHNITLPATLDQEQQSKKQYLTSITAPAFDTAYMRIQVLDHQATFTLLQNEVNSGRNPDAKSYAAEMIPHVQMHLRMADSIYNLIK